MKKKLYFDNKIDTDIDYSIEIHGGRIRNFKGHNMAESMIKTILNGGIIDDEIIKPLDIEKDFEFTIEKIKKYDKIKFGIKGNYIIKSKAISQYILVKTYIKLNLIEKFKIDYSKGETVFHKMNLLEKIITTFIFPLIIGLIIFYLTVYSTKENKKDTKPTLNSANQQINDIKKANSHSNQQIKLDRDSLSRK